MELAVRRAMNCSRTVQNCVAALVMAAALCGCGLAVDNAERLQRADEAFSNADYRTASIDAKAVLQDEPENVQARLLLGKASMELGDAAAALPELERALSLGASRSDVIVYLARAQLGTDRAADMLAGTLSIGDLDAGSQNDLSRLRGQAHMQLGDYELARESFRAALVLDETDMPSMLGIVSAYVAEQDLAQARATLDEILAQEDGNADAWLLSGAVYQAVGDPTSALASFSRALDVLGDSGNPGRTINALVGQAEAHFLLQDLEAARSASDRLNELARDDFRSTMIRARVAAADRRWDDAEEDLQQLLVIAPGYVPAQMLLGAVHLQNGNLQQAEMFLSIAAGADPSNAETRRLLAETRMRQGEVSEASDIMRALVEDSGDQASLAMAARASLAAGDQSQAVAYLERRAAQAPADESAQLDLAAAYVVAGRLEDARNLLENVTAADDGESRRRELIELIRLIATEDRDAIEAQGQVLLDGWPDDPQVILLVANTFQRLDMEQRAEALFTRIGEINPDDVSGHLSRGQIDFAAGDFDAAEDHYLDALTIDGDNSEVLTSLGIVAARKNDGEAARSYFEQAVSADPAAVPPRVLLTRLLLLTGDVDGASTLLGESIAQVGDQPDLLSVAAQLSERQGDLEDAANRYRAVLEQTPVHLDSLDGLARVSLASGDVATALDASQRAYDRSPLRTETVALRVTALLRADRGDEALSVARTFRQADTGNVMAAALLGQVQLNRQEYAAAATTFDAVIGSEDATPNMVVAASEAHRLAGLGDANEILADYLGDHPDAAIVRSMLASSLMSSEENAEAIAEYEQVLRTRPDDLVALNNLAWLYSQAGDDRAGQIASRAYQLYPDNPSVVDTYAWIEIQGGDVQKGVQALQRTVDAGTASPEHRYHLARGLRDMGDAAAAGELLRDLLADEADFASREDAEALLRSL